MKQRHGKHIVAGADAEWRQEAVLEYAHRAMAAKREMIVFVIGANAGGVVVRSRNVRGRLTGHTVCVCMYGGWGRGGHTERGRKGGGKRERRRGREGGVGGEGGRGGAGGETGAEKSLNK